MKYFPRTCFLVYIRIRCNWTYPVCSGDINCNWSRFLGIEKWYRWGFIIQVDHFINVMYGNNCLLFVSRRLKETLLWLVLLRTFRNLLCLLFDTLFLGTVIARNLLFAIFWWLHQVAFERHAHRRFQTRILFTTINEHWWQWLCLTFDIEIIIRLFTHLRKQ